jgi:hypothetical protein
MFPSQSDVDEEEKIESVNVGSKFVRWATFLVAGVLWIVAGNGQKTNTNCGKYSRVKVCLNVDLHGRTTLDGKNYAGKVFRRIIHNSCGRPSCPECYISWASRAARKVAFVLGEAAKQYGKVEHLVASVPVKDYDLSFEDMRRKAVKILNSRGVIGGSLIFHGARFNRIKGFYWSPHFHCLGFVFNGYRCRNCKRKNDCIKGCGGLDDVNWQKYQVDKWYVKVCDPRHERRNVRKTAAYELGHCTIKANAKNFRVITYWGVCSYRRLKISDKARAEFEAKFKDKCPLCGDELKNGKYCGVKQLVIDRRNPDFRRDGFEDFLENGFPAWFVEDEG